MNSTDTDILGDIYARIALWSHDFIIGRERSSNETRRRGLSVLLRSLCVSVVLIGLIGTAWAEEGPPEGDFEEETPTKREGTVAAIDRVHEMVSSGISETADRIDAFFGAERAEEETNRSYLKVGLVRVSDEDGTELRSEVRLKVVLPRLQERLQLIIEREGESETFEPEADTRGVQAPVRDARTTDGVRSALRLILRATRDLNIFLDGGVRVRIPPTVFARLRFRKSVALDQWTVRFTQSVQWEEEFEDHLYPWEAVSRLDVERSITSDFFFRSSLQGAWFEGEHGYFVGQRFALVHLLSKRRALVYEWNTLARTGRIVKTENDDDVVVDPDTRFRIEETAFGIRYRQTVGWPWLFFEFDPEMAFRRDFDRDTGFDGLWRFLVRLEVQFGGILYDAS